MKAFFQEFKNFAVQGNVIDVAVGVVIGGAFGKITTSLVTNIIMPPIGILLGGVDFTDFSFPWQIRRLKPWRKLRHKGYLLLLTAFLLIRS